MQNKVLNYPMAQKNYSNKILQCASKLQVNGFYFTKPSFVLNVMAVV